MGNNNANTFMVRLKNDGRIFSRHYRASNGKKAAMHAKGKGKILSVKKVHPWDIVGTIDTMKLKDIIGVTPEFTGERRKNVVFDSETIDNIVFPKRASSLRKHNRSRAKPQD